MCAAVANQSDDLEEDNNHEKPGIHSVEKNASFQSLPGKKTRRLNFNRFESTPQERWKAIKKWVGNSFLQQPTAKTSQKQESTSLERQIELNTLFPLILAMQFSKDENNMKRIPVFLNQLTVKVDKVSDDEQEEDDDDNDSIVSTKKHVKKRKFRPNIFKIRVQYGDGPKKISWLVYRRYWDFVKLHYRYRKRYNTTRENINRNLMKNKTKPPKFPSIPKRHLQRKKQQPDSSYFSQSDLRRNPDSILDEDGVMALIHPNDDTTAATDSTLTTGIPPLLSTHQKNHSNLSTPLVDVIKVDPVVLNAMEDYLNQFIATIPPCGNINRLCKFLEISALGLHLTSKYPNQAYHGKEGFAVFQSRTDHDPKQTHRFLQDGLVCSFPTTGGRRRRKPKWFMVRESYVVCVNDPSETEIYDVFLFDQAFDVHRLDIFGDKSKHRIKSKKKLSNALANASHWTSGKATLCLKNMQGVYHFRAKNEQQAKQFERSIQHVASKSIWTKDNRFASFAPIRHNSAVSWFVDGRDYFWDISVALENAKESIYIHDWWLSPELFLRRPAARNLEWRLDRVLRRKADQGVKVYIVMYKEVAMALPLFSHQAKRHLLSLSPNIFVQRHPSRALDIFNKNSIFFWAHHEKICVIDNEVAFIGGLDLCFGRYDTPGHILVDDLDPELHVQVSNPQVWPGKDYSNPRIVDFHTLDKPFEDNQDRTLLPRMPWHDISMRIVGPAARDVARHFIQRWNFLRRKKPSAPKRPTPMLLPVPDKYINSLPATDSRICHPFTSESCHVQILRSVSPWSIGSTDDHVEHSIQTAYCDSIRDSEHFIYIENQFFISATKNGTVAIENKIGDAIFERILRAFKEGKKWRAIIVIPLVPGFPANIDETEATTVRLIMQYQYYSIGRGPNSILARLHDAGVLNTHEYINVYGLRNWAELNGQFVTEQVYIHSKTMIVDDLKVIIGSANINERSQLGSRDSEIAAHIEEDKDLIDSTLNGQPVKVSRFAHSLRMRLMSEHIGLDVDQIDRERFGDKTSDYFTKRLWSDHKLDEDDKNDGINCVPPYIQVTKNMDQIEKERQQIQQEEKDEVDISEVERNRAEGSSDSEDTDSANETHVKEQKVTRKKNKRKKFKSLISKNDVSEQEQEGGQEAAEANAASGEKRLSNSNSIEPVQSSHTDKSSTLSPSKSLFSKRKSTKEDYLDFWTSLDPDTDNNGDMQFQDIPNEKLTDLQKDYYNSLKVEDVKLKDKTIGDIINILKDPLSDEFQDFWHLLARFNTDLFRRSFLVIPDNNVRTWDQYNHFIKMAKLFLGRTDVKHGGTKTTVAATNVTVFPLNKENGGEASIRDIICHIRGHLVIWPNHFMEDDDYKNDFLFNVDKIVPIEIFD